ncbi:MAG: ATP-binding protein, partial [Trebonia sp.]
VTLAGRRPAGLRAADSDPLLAGLYDDLAAAPSGVLADPAIARALGVRTSLAGLLTEPGGPDELLTRLADEARPVSRPQLRALWSALATADLTPDDVTPPDKIRAIRGTEIVVADADDVLILDAPDLWPLVADQPLVLGPHTMASHLADLLDLPLASEEVSGVTESAGEPHPVPEIVRSVLANAPETYQSHDKLVVDGVEIPWRYRDGMIHAATPQGLACALAWAAGRWQGRHVLATLLTNPDDTARALADADLEG